MLEREYQKVFFKKVFYFYIWSEIWPKKNSKHFPHEITQF